MANTSVPLSEVAIANMAAQALDDCALTSLDDDSVVGRFMTRQFGYVRDELLRIYPWAFAKKRVILAEEVTKPAFDWSASYQLPSDCIRLIELRGDGQWNGQPPPYELEGRSILCNTLSKLKVIYVRRVTNAAEFDPLFARALGLRIALLIAQTVTGKQSYVPKIQAMYQGIMDEAMHTDSLERGMPEDQSRSSTLSVRGI